MAGTKTASQKFNQDEKKQRALSQIKRQVETPEYHLSGYLKKKNKPKLQNNNQMKIGNLPEKEFRIMIVKMIQDLRKEWRQRLRRCKKCLLKTKKN